MILNKNFQIAKYVEHVLVKLSKSSGILYRIRESLPITVRLNYHYAFIHSYLTIQCNSLNLTIQCNNLNIQCNIMGLDLVLLNLLLVNRRELNGLK